jgi:beta-glucanase (GH16 family)
MPLLITFLAALMIAPAAAGSDGHAQWIAFNRGGAENSNLQCFTPGNVQVAEGNLVITSKNESARCSSFDLAPATDAYTSGFIAMRGFSFLYGTVTYRAKLGGGNGTGAWPIVWMADASCQKSDPSGTDNNCNDQEIDVSEILNSDFTRINQQIHVDRFKHNDGCSPHVSDVSQNYHVYQLDWSPGLLIFKVDGTVTCTIRKTYVPSGPMYVKMNTFVGGVGGGAVNPKTLPWQTQVDYVRVTQAGKLIFSDEFNDGRRIEAGEFVTISPASASNIKWNTLESSLLNKGWILASVFVAAAIAACSVVYRWKSKRENSGSRS